MLDPKQRFEPAPAPDCVVAFAIYANFDGNAPDSDSVAYVSSRELAEALVPIIKSKYDNLRYCESCEHAKAWQFLETVAKRENVATTLEEAIAQLGDEDLADDD